MREIVLRREGRKASEAEECGCMGVVGFGMVAVECWSLLRHLGGGTRASVGNDESGELGVIMCVVGCWCSGERRRNDFSQAPFPPQKKTSHSSLNIFHTHPTISFCPLTRQTIN